MTPQPQKNDRVIDNLDHYARLLAKEPGQTFLFAKPVLAGLKSRSELLQRNAPFSKDPEMNENITAVIGLFDIGDQVEFKRHYPAYMADKVPSHQQGGKGKVLGYLSRSDKPLSLLVHVANKIAVLPINPNHFQGGEFGYQARRLDVKPRARVFKLMLKPGSPPDKSEEKDSEQQENAKPVKFFCKLWVRAL